MSSADELFSLMLEDLGYPRVSRTRRQTPPPGVRRSYQKSGDGDAVLVPQPRLPPKPSSPPRKLEQRVVSSSAPGWDHASRAEDGRKLSTSSGNQDETPQLTCAEGTGERLRHSSTTEVDQASLTFMDEGVKQVLRVVGPSSASPDAILFSPPTQGEVIQLWKKGLRGHERRSWTPSRSSITRRSPSPTPKVGGESDRALDVPQPQPSAIPRFRSRQVPSSAVSQTVAPRPREKLRRAVNSGLKSRGGESTASRSRSPQQPSSSSVSRRNRHVEITTVAEDGRAHMRRVARERALRLADGNKSPSDHTEKLAARDVEEKTCEAFPPRALSLRVSILERARGVQFSRRRTPLPRTNRRTDSLPLSSKAEETLTDYLTTTSSPLPLTLLPSVFSPGAIYSSEAAHERGRKQLAALQAGQLSLFHQAKKVMKEFQRSQNSSLQGVIRRFRLAQAQLALALVYRRRQRGALRRLRQSSGATADAEDMTRLESPSSLLGLGSNGGRISRALITRHWTEEQIHSLRLDCHRQFLRIFFLAVRQRRRHVALQRHLALRVAAARHQATSLFVLTTLRLNALISRETIQRCDEHRVRQLLVSSRKALQRWRERNRQKAELSVAEEIVLYRSKLALKERCFRALRRCSLLDKAEAIHRKLSSAWYRRALSLKSFFAWREVARSSALTRSRLNAATSSIMRRDGDSPSSSPHFPSRSQQGAGPKLMEHLASLQGIARRYVFEARGLVRRALYASTAPLSGSVQRHSTERGGEVVAIVPFPLPLALAMRQVLLLRQRGTRFFHSQAGEGLVSSLLARQGHNAEVAAGFISCLRSSSLRAVRVDEPPYEARVEALAWGLDFLDSPRLDPSSYPLRLCPSSQPPSSTADHRYAPVPHQRCYHPGSVVSSEVSVPPPSPATVGPPTFQFRELRSPETQNVTVSLRDEEKKEQEEEDMAPELKDHVEEAAARYYRVRAGVSALQWWKYFGVRSRVHRALRQRAEHRRIARAFTHLRKTVETIKEKKRYCEEKGTRRRLIRVFTAWRLASEYGAAVSRRTAESFRDLHVLHSTFLKMKEGVRRRRKKRRMKDRAESWRVVWMGRAAVRWWHKFARRSRLRRHVERELLWRHHRGAAELSFLAWAIYARRRAVLRRVVTRAESLYEAAAQQDDALVDFAALRCAMEKWRESVEATLREKQLKEQINAATSYCNTNLLVKCMKQWRVSTAQSRRVGEMTHERNRGTLSSVFQAWVSYHNDHKRKMMEFLYRWRVRQPLVHLFRQWSTFTSVRRCGNRLRLSTYFCQLRQWFEVERREMPQLLRRRLLLQRGLRALRVRLLEKGVMHAAADFHRFRMLRSSFNAFRLHWQRCVLLRSLLSRLRLRILRRVWENLGPPSRAGSDVWTHVVQHKSGTAGMKPIIPFAADPSGSTHEFTACRFEDRHASGPPGFGTSGKSLPTGYVVRKGLAAGGPRQWEGRLDVQEIASPLPVWKVH